MDIYVYVNLFCNEAAKIDRTFRFMRSWYLFSDTRAGKPEDRYFADAEFYRRTGVL